MIQESTIVHILSEHYSGIQAVYLFGSWGTEDEWPGSDVDVAVLLEPRLAKKAGSLALSRARVSLESVLHRNVDLLNLRLVNTVMQKEVVANGRRIFCADEYEVESFEMLVFSLYQKLNEERSDIVKEVLKSGRFYSL
jgi:predicted nucleotidyltransferase